jgi:hypothetical protein
VDDARILTVPSSTQEHVAVSFEAAAVVAPKLKASISEHRKDSPMALPVAPPRSLLVDRSTWTKAPSGENALDKRVGAGRGSWDDRIDRVSSPPTNSIA